MKKFLVIYHAPTDFMAQAAERSPEEMKEGMEQWNQWAAKCGDQLLDFGLPLMGGQRLMPGGKSESSSKGVVGYSLIQARWSLDFEAALVCIVIICIIGLIVEKIFFGVIEKKILGYQGQTKVTT